MKHWQATEPKVDGKMQNGMLLYQLTSSKSQLGFFEIFRLSCIFLVVIVKMDSVMFE